MKTDLRTEEIVRNACLSYFDEDDEIRVRFRDMPKAAVRYIRDMDSITFYIPYAFRDAPSDVLDGIMRYVCDEMHGLSPKMPKYISKWIRGTQEATSQ